ncbi:P-type conjugative transfer protein TrbL [Polynucleobacter sp. Fuers-14]|uniref:P-type conjugative transfer protein TrbL n=1 Tax=Polynucleobacter sp. Fuers-14 TaxID=1758364 RepID=UPI001C0B9109|nr:P-type conjugative transfer protein TrbL [Polynucleobacter sp. Fuers-14]MBU3641009.1 P-type conjugative transfer protein TrbL [Polynucleobacter sp. Fuers-14]
MISSISRRALTGAFLLLISINAFAQGAPGSGGVLDSVLAQYVTSTASWMKLSQGFANHIFMALGGLDIAWWGIKNLLKKNDLVDYIAGFTLKILSIFFFYGIIVNSPTWIPMITNTFMFMGGQIAGGGATNSTPSSVMWLGAQTADAIIRIYDTAQGTSAVTAVLGNPFLALATLAAALFTLIGFAFISLQLLMTQIELSVVSGIGLVMLGFTGSSLTSTFGEKYIGYIVSVGIKLMLIFAIASLGPMIAAQQAAFLNSQASLPGGPNAANLLVVGIAMLIYGLLGLMVPGIAGSLMNGSPSMSLGSVAGAGAAAAGAVAGVGMAGLGAAAGAASAGAAGVGHLASLAGAGNLVSGGLTGAGQALGSALGSMAPSTSGVSGLPAASTDPFAGTATPPSAPASGGSNAIGGSNASATPAADSQSTLSKGMDKLGQAHSLAGAEGNSGGVSVNLGHAGD